MSLDTIGSILLFLMVAWGGVGLGKWVFTVLLVQCPRQGHHWPHVWLKTMHVKSQVPRRPRVCLGL